MNPRNAYWSWCVLLATVLFSSCRSLQSVTHLKPSPREVYVAGLTKSNLITTSMVKTWLRAGDVSLHDSILVTLPFRETGFFPSSEPQARYYRFDVKTGQVLTITTVMKSKESARVFLDIFGLQEGRWKELAHGDSLLNMTYEFVKGGNCLVRLQPELLVNLFYSITLSVTPVLLNPVQGATNKSIGSFYDDPRDLDGVKRKHEGIDIFAKKGTLVIAPTDGFVSRVGTNTLGGKVVWMDDVKRGHSYYFAHLDSQIVKAGTKVKQGDVLGTVGNTGNAKYTPSHLHFGVYQRTSKDPIAYIRTMEKLFNELAPDTLFQSIVFKVSRKNTTLYRGPVRNVPMGEPVGKDTYIKVIAQSNDWYRVVTADEQEGFVERSNVIPADQGNPFMIKKEVLLLSEAKRNAVPVGTISGPAIGLASYKHFRFIKTQQGQTGWIDLAEVF